MNKLGIFVSIVAIVGSLTVASLTASAGEAAPPCVHKDLKTELVKQACAKGGQPAAKAAMKAFNKEKGINSCNKCHSKLAPSYDLKPDGLAQYTKLGAK